MNPYASRGRFYYDQDRYVDAIQEFTRELADTPDSADIHAWISLCYYRLENKKATLEHAQRAVALEPDNDFGYYSLAFAETLAKRPKKAEAAIRKALEIEPHSASNYGILGWVLGNQDRWKAALEAAETGLSIEPDDEFCLQIRAHALSLAGRKDDAIVAAQQNTAENPDSPHAHATLGWVFLRKGDHKAAESHFSDALRIDPQQELAREGLLESLRSRFPLYRWMIQFGAWQSQFSKGGQLVIILAILAFPRILRAIAKSNPQAQPYLIPVAVCVSALIWFTWIGEPLTNIVLLAHPLGRLALERHVRFETAVIAIYMALAFISLLLGIFLGPTFFVVAGLLLVGILLMALSCRVESTRWLRHVLFGGTASLAAIGVIVVLIVKFL